MKHDLSPQTAPFFILAAVFAACAACSGDAPLPAGSPPVTDTLAGGVVRVTNREADGWADGDPWTLVEELRLGSVDGPEEQLFSGVVSVLSDESGNIHLLTRLPLRIAVFDADGVYSHGIGRPGEGPGEFGLPLGMAFAPNGHLWVADDSRLLYSVFRPDGSVAAIHTRRATGHGALDRWPGAFTRDGELLELTLAPSTLADGGASGGVRYHPTRVSMTGSTIVETMTEITYRFTQNSRGAFIPFAPELMVRCDEFGDLWLATTNEYALHRTSLAGDTSLIFTLDSRPEPVTREERDQILEWERESSGPRLADEDIPGVKPIIESFFPGGEHLFVVPQLAGEATGKVLDVFTRDGVFVGRLELPVPLAHPPNHISARGDVIYVAWSDDLDVDYVSRLRIAR